MFEIKGLTLVLTKKLLKHWQLTLFLLMSSSASEHNLRAMKV